MDIRDIAASKTFKRMGGYVIRKSVFDRDGGQVNIASIGSFVALTPVLVKADWWRWLFRLGGRLGLGKDCEAYAG